MYDIQGGASPDSVYGDARALCMENVRCGVVLLDQTCKTESKIRKELSRLKECQDTYNSIYYLN